MLGSAYLWLCTSSYCSVLWLWVQDQCYMHLPASLCKLSANNNRHGHHNMAVTLVAVTLVWSPVNKISRHQNFYWILWFINIVLSYKKLSNCPGLSTNISAKASALVLTVISKARLMPVQDLVQDKLTFKIGESTSQKIKIATDTPVNQTW